MTGNTTESSATAAIRMMNRSFLSVRCACSESRKRWKGTHSRLGSAATLRQLYNSCKLQVSALMEHLTLQCPQPQQIRLLGWHRQGMDENWDKTQKKRYNKLMHEQHHLRQHRHPRLPRQPRYQRHRHRIRNHDLVRRELAKNDECFAMLDRTLRTQTIGQTLTLDEW